jgi:hypothetical protein
MTETADYTKGQWAHHNFDDARKQFELQVQAGRTYGGSQPTTQKAIAATAELPDQIETDSETVLVLVFDLSASMNDYPGEAFVHMPYLDIECRSYLGPSPVIGLYGFSDVNYDQHPLQARPFATGPALAEEILRLKVDQNGGKGIEESAELMALYLARNMNTPKAKAKPIVIFVTDEIPYGRIDRRRAQRYVHVRLQKDMETVAVFEELRANHSVYAILKPYTYPDGRVVDPITQHVRQTWAGYLGDDHLAELPDPKRISDVVFGILAQETGKVEYFNREIQARQTPAQIAVASQALQTIHGPRHMSRSVMRFGGGNT